jgi:hypothetical protein
MEVPAPFQREKGRHNSVSLNRRESYPHKKMNASDFFHLFLKKIGLTPVIVPELPESEYFWSGCIDFWISCLASGENLRGNLE